MVKEVSFSFQILFRFLVFTSVLLLYPLYPCFCGCRQLNEKTFTGVLSLYLFSPSQRLSCFFS